jgi:hypothetical protein
MNERIKQLAEQAGGVFSPMTGRNLDKFDTEKFAELIVKECIFLNMDTLTHIENEKLIPAYEKHFGVK